MKKYHALKAELLTLHYIIVLVQSHYETNNWSLFKFFKPENFFKYVEGYK